MRVNFQGVYSTFTPVAGGISRDKFYTIPQNRLSSDVFVPSSSTISFGRLTTKFPFALLKDIPCPYCGIKMVTEADFEKYLTKETLSGTGRMAVKAITRFEDSMQEPEKRIFQKLQELSKKNPLSNLQDLLMSVMPESLKRLQTTQLNILNKLAQLSPSLPKEYSNELNMIVKRHREIINSPDNNIRFKRKNLLNSIYNLQLSLPDKKMARELENIAYSMPNSMNHYDSFVVKYSERTPFEIGQRLVRPSMGTFEHVHPHSHGGTADLSNGLCVCGKCNHTRGNLPFSDLVDSHPEIKTNIKQHLQLIGKIIKKRDMASLKDYVKNIAETIKNESEGKIDLTKII
ncbi:MAG TPA: HNH endonuclease signature motif containing protein [Candidatus Gastranaerophilaceae bacterium]|nr:HNH endonuclease signature motif containing protein [Candidatus Gastranaerophilaceae bacterium]